MKYALFNHAKQMKILIILGQKLLLIPFFGEFLSKLIEFVVRIVYSSDISCRATIPADVEFAHGQDIVIGRNVIIGARCKIFNGVTLGNKDTELASNAQPTVGCDCVLSTGAKILGGISIGDRSIVGANAVVIRDVPADSLAVGVPARIVHRKTAEPNEFGQ